MHINEIKNQLATATEILSQAARSASEIADSVSRDLAGRLIRYQHKDTGKIIEAKAGIAQLRGDKIVLLVYKINRTGRQVATREHCVIDFSQVMDCTPEVAPINEQTNHGDDYAKQEAS